MIKKNEKQQMIHLLRDGEITAEEKDRLAAIRAAADGFDEESQAEEEWLEALGQAIRQDSERTLEKVAFNNLAASVIQQIESEEQLAGKGLLAWLFGRTHRSVLALLCILVLTLATFYGIRLPEEALQDSEKSGITAGCVIDHVENKQSTSVIFKAGERDEAVTVIWIFEEDEGV